METGEWQDVRSPYSGELVGRVARARADDARSAVNAAADALARPLPAHKRAEILSRVAGRLGRRHEEVAQVVCAEAGKPLKAARVETTRAMSTYTMAAVEARKLTSRVVPDGRLAVRRGEAPRSRFASPSAPLARSPRSTSR